MLPRAFVLLALAPMLAAGCLGGGGPAPGAPRDGGEAPGAAVAEAPWWNIGESWTIRFQYEDGSSRAATMVNFANNTFGDPEHFWLGVSDRDQAMRHVFYEVNPFLGRIHWDVLAPHARGKHATMFDWPLRDGKMWSGHVMGYDWTRLQATARGDGGFDVTGGDASGRTIAYDYDPATRWFSHIEIKDGARTLFEAEVTDHRESGATGTYQFLRGRDYLDSSGGDTGDVERFTVADEGAQSMAFLLNVNVGGIGTARLEFIDPAGNVYHSQTLQQGRTSDEIVEVRKPPMPGEWRLRYVGQVDGDIRVRGVIEYKATL